MKQDKEKLEVLRACTDENGTVERIAKKSGIKENKVKEILENLEKSKLIHHPFKNDKNLWSKTKEGEKYLKENTFVNEFGELYTKQEVKEIAERILKLPDKLIDELWYKCGFIYQRPKEAILYEDKNKDFKAIFDELIEELRKLKEGSETLISFLSETPKKDVLERLSKIEDEMKSKKYTGITKEQLKEYLIDNWDVTFEQIVKKFKISKEDFPKVEKFLEELEKEGWIMKSFCGEHKTYEYDPAPEQWR